jgi:hypothetical protein
MAEIFQPVLVKFHILATKKKALATCIRTFGGGEGRGAGGWHIVPTLQGFLFFLLGILNI